MSIRAWRAARPPFCITFSVWLPAADFIMQVMPDIRFPVTDSDYLFLYLPPAVRPCAPKPAASGNFLFLSRTVQ
uniref:ST54 protein n=1 Tax=Escherichia coli TaxID=562 RepID=Q8VNR1_ECOLX|nr:ST54 protein [Escherichia coli]